MCVCIYIYIYTEKVMWVIVIQKTSYMLWKYFGHCGVKNYVNSVNLQLRDEQGLKVCEKGRLMIIEANSEKHSRF